MKRPISNGPEPATEGGRDPSAGGVPPPTGVTQTELAAARPPKTTRTTPPGVQAVQLRKAGGTSAQLRDDDYEPVTDVGLPRLDLGPRPVPKPDRGLLLRMDGVHAGQVHMLGRCTVRIGRHPKNDVHIDDSGISRFHACIEWQQDHYSIEDLASRNGTAVGGVVVTRKELGDGDWIQLGPSACFRYSWTDRGQEELLRQLYESSTRDALTGAFNRRHFEERLDAEIAYALRQDADVALVLFDIDHFKRINDTYGHQAGDAVLQQLAATATRRLRSEDVLARFGGEEFAVILRGTSELGAGLVAERLRSLVAALPAIVEGKPIPATISAGCASLAFSAELSAKELIAAADRRLYSAKGRGRNRVVASD